MMPARAASISVALEYATEVILWPFRNAMLLMVEMVDEARWVA